MGRGSVAVLDVRSSELTVIVGEKGVNNTFLFKTMRTEPYDGYQNGAFFDVANLKESVLRALAAAEQVCGERIKKLYIGVPGEFTKVIPREQEIGFSKKRKIGQKELDMLFESGREDVENHSFMRAASMIYVTADNRRVVDPAGLSSTGLSGVLSYFYCTNYFVKTMEDIFSGTKIVLEYLPAQLAMASYLIPPETRDEYALFLDVGFLSSSILVMLGGGALLQKTFWAGRGQIAFRLMQKFSLPYDAALALLASSNLYVRSDVKMREFMHAGISYEIDMDVMTEEIKAGLDELCESVGEVLEDCAGKEIENKPLYYSGEGMDGIRGGAEHISKRLSRVCELLVPDLAYYNKPAMSSRVALLDMAYEENRKLGLLYRLLNGFGG